MRTILLPGGKPSEADVTTLYGIGRALLGLQEEGT